MSTRSASDLYECFDFAGFTVEIMGASAVQASAEEEIASLPSLPLQQRSFWPSRSPGEHWYLLRLTSPDRQQRPIEVGLREFRMRSIPGGRVLRVLKFGPGAPPEQYASIFGALAEVARRWRRVMRLHVEVCQVLTPGLLPATIEVARGLEFIPSVPREYAHTSLVPLDPDFEIRSATFHRSVLKNVRKTARAGHVIRSIDDERFVPRMSRLLEETMERTGGERPAVSLPDVVRVSVRHPASFRLLGLFRDGEYTPEALMAYRWCGCTGAYADDLLAASTRWVEGDQSVPMMHAIMLAMFDWAASQGARLFDFGGVVLPDDPRFTQLGSISRFKELFGGAVHQVGVDLTFTPRPVLAKAGAWLSNLAK